MKVCGTLKKVSVNLSWDRKHLGRKLDSILLVFDEWYESASQYRRFQLSVGWGGGVRFTKSIYADA